MDYRRFDSTIVVRLDKGDEIITSLEHICTKEQIKLGVVSGIGAVDKATIGIFDTVDKSYYSGDYTGDYEIVSLTGNISTMKEKPYLHLHIAIGNNKNNEIHGGHLNKAIISATGEIFINIIDGAIDREFSNTIGLNLIKF